MTDVATTLKQIQCILQQEQQSIHMDMGRLRQIEEDIQTLLARKEEYGTALAEMEKAFEVFQMLEQAWHSTFEERLSALVSRGLSLVFQEPLRLVLETKTRGDLSAIEFKLAQVIDGEELVTDILDAKGGGVVAVVAFLLRVLVLMAARPALRPFMALDESFAHVSSEYIPTLSQLLRQIVDETGIQILLVTHEPSFADTADRVYEVTQTNGVSQYTLVKDHADNCVHG